MKLTGKNVVHILLIAVILVIEVAVVVKLPRIPLLSARGELESFEEAAYAMRRNVFGYDIFINENAAEKTFTETYADAISYMEEKYGREYTGDYDSRQFFMTYGWQTSVTGVMGEPDEAKTVNLQFITTYEVVYMHGMWEYILEYSDVTDWLIWLAAAVMVAAVDVLLIRVIVKK